MKLGGVQSNLITQNRAAASSAPKAEATPQAPLEQFTRSENHDSYKMHVFKRGVVSAAEGAVPFYGAYKFAASAFTSGIMGSGGTTPAVIGAAVNLGSSVALCFGNYQVGLSGLALSAALGPAAKLSYL
jgi:hypothetical protein